jgi:hypothetical protein
MGDELKFLQVHLPRLSALSHITVLPCLHFRPDPHILQHARCCCPAGGFVLALTFTPLFLWRAASLLEFNETAQEKLLAEEAGQQHPAAVGMAPLQEVCVAAGDAPLKPTSLGSAEVSSGTPPWKQAPPAGGTVQMAHQGPHI